MTLLRQAARLWCFWGVMHWADQMSLVEQAKEKLLSLPLRQ